MAKSAAQRGGQLSINLGLTQVSVLPVDHLRNGAWQFADFLLHGTQVLRLEDPPALDVNLLRF